MNEELLNQARKNILDSRKQDLNEEILEEYEELIFETEKLKADKKTLAKIKELHKQTENIWPRNWGDSFNVHGLKETISEYAKTGVYHPKTLKAIENEIKVRVN